MVVDAFVTETEVVDLACALLEKVIKYQVSTVGRHIFPIKALNRSLAVHDRLMRMCCAHDGRPVEKAIENQVSTVGRFTRMCCAYDGELILIVLSENGCHRTMVEYWF